MQTFAALPKYKRSLGRMEVHELRGESGGVGGRRAVGFLPNNFRACIFFCSVDVLICACVQMFALRAFVSLRFGIFFVFPLPTPYTYIWYVYMYIYIYVCICCIFLFFVAQSNFLAVFLVIFATTANKLCSSKWKLCNVH